MGLFFSHYKRLNLKWTMKNFSITFFLLLWTCSIYGQWSINPASNTPVCSALNKQVDPRILEDGAGGAFIVWKDYRNSVPDIYVQRINQFGVVLWALNGVGVCTDAADQSTWSASYRVHPCPGILPTPSPPLLHTLVRLTG